MQAGVARERRDALVETRVVLHRARAERVEAGVEVEVAARDAVEVAHDLGLGDLGELGGPLAALRGRDQLVDRALGDARLGDHRGPTAFARALEDRHRAVALHRRLAVEAGGARAPAHRATSATLPRAFATAAPRLSARRSMSSRVRRSVIATRSPSACSGYSRASGYPAAIPSAAQ